MEFCLDFMDRYFYVDFVTLVDLMPFINSNTAFLEIENRCNPGMISDLDIEPLEFTDSDLFEEIEKKQTWALELLYDRHAARLNGLAIKILNDKHLAEDVLQELFMNIWKRAACFDQSKGTPLGWMLIMCRNRCIDRLRSKASAQKRSTTIDEDVLQIADDWSEVSPDVLVDYNDLQRDIRGALATLPPEQSLPIEMAFFQGYSQTEISTCLSLPLGTVKTRLRLGMQKLRFAMQEVYS